MSGPLCFRTMPVSSELGEGGMFSFQALCSFMRKGMRGNLWLPNYPVGTGPKGALCLLHSLLPLPPLAPVCLQAKPSTNSSPPPPSTSLPGHLTERTWRPALRIPGQHALQGLVTCSGRNFGPCAHSLMAKRLTSIENRVGDPVNKQEEVRFVTAFAAWLNGEIYTGNVPTPTWDSPRVHSASVFLFCPCPSPAGACLSWMISPGLSTRLTL